VYFSVSFGVVNWYVRQVIGWEELLSSYLLCWRVFPAKNRLKSFFIVIILFSVFPTRNIFNFNCLTATSLSKAWLAYLCWKCRTQSVYQSSIVSELAIDINVGCMWLVRLQIAAVHSAAGNVNAVPVEHTLPLCDVAGRKRRPTAAADKGCR